MDGPFKAMGRESRELTLEDFMGGRDLPEVDCERCGGVVREGDWPFCKGNADEHKRD